jgi:hypothetical protein
MPWLSEVVPDDSSSRQCSLGTLAMPAVNNELMSFHIQSNALDNMPIFATHTFQRQSLLELSGRARAF